MEQLNTLATFIGKLKFDKPVNGPIFLCWTAVASRLVSFLTSSFSSFFHLETR